MRLSDLLMIIKMLCLLSVLSLMFDCKHGRFVWRIKLVVYDGVNFDETILPRDRCHRDDDFSVILSPHADFIVILTCNLGLFSNNFSICYHEYG